MTFTRLCYSRKHCSQNDNKVTKGMHYLSELAYVRKRTRLCRRADKLQASLFVGEFARRRVDQYSAKQVPCVWYSLSPSLQTQHDVGNVHHVQFHKNVEGNYKFRISLKRYLRSFYSILMTFQILLKYLIDNLQ